jgi:hypothetical protein
MPEITPEEMGKAKVGFAIRFINRALVADVMMPDALNDHNQAALEYFLTIQEQASAKLGKYCVRCHSLPRRNNVFAAAIDKPTSARNTKSIVNVRSFLKFEEGNPFYVLPVISEPLFPQFKGPRTPGVVRTERQ